MLWEQLLVYMIYVNHVINQANIVLDYSNESIEEFVKRINEISITHDGVFVDSDYAIKECTKRYTSYCCRYP